MKILLDTQAWIWMVLSPERLSAHAKRHIMKEGNERFLSAASTWEISIKYGLGKLPLHEPPALFIPRLLTTTRTLPLAIQHSHAIRTADLPPHHKDPFDRLLIAQALVEDIPIMTSDFEMFSKYGVKIVKAV